MQAGYELFPDPTATTRLVGLAASEVERELILATLRATGGNRTELRTSAPPSLPLLEPPVRAARGAAPEFEPTQPASVPRPTGTSPNVRVGERPPPVLLPPEIPRVARP